MDDSVRADRLEIVLASVGRHLATDAGAPAAGTPIAVPSPWRRRLLAAAIVLVVVAAAVATFAPARRVLSGWLGAGEIEVEIDPDLVVEPALPTFVDGVSPLAVDRLDDALGMAVPDVAGSELGPPQAWWTPPERGVLATWDEGATSLWIVRTDDAPELLVKWLRNPDRSSDQPALGDGGYAIGAEHTFDTPYRRIRAQNVVAWTDGDVMFRLDSSIASDTLLVVAQGFADG